MSFNTKWDVDKYRDDHESEEHWMLRKAFMERWKDDYSEERLVCLARVFANMEFMGCRYPVEVMQEVARLSQEVVQQYRQSKKSKLQRTFVSASDAAEDRAKGVKREGGIILGAPKKKSAQINFVAQGQNNDNDVDAGDDDDGDGDEKKTGANEENEMIENKEIPESNKRKSEAALNEYMEELLNTKCLDVWSFNESMFHTQFGKLVLLVRPWTSKLSNLQSSCQACNVTLASKYDRGCFSISLNGKLLAQATGSSKLEAKSIVEMMAWNRLREEVICVLVKEMYIPQGDSRISVNDVSGQPEFGQPIENSVATKMMKLMGWKGGGLGADSQGIAEPIKPNLRMVNRSGLGSDTGDSNQLRRRGMELMRRFLAADTLDVDLVFSSEFSKEERALLHQCAQRIGLGSRSYGDVDRFLVIKKKLDPFSLVRAITEKGGCTPKYQVFIPAGIRRNGR